MGPGKPHTNTSVSSALRAAIGASERSLWLERVCHSHVVYTLDSLFAETPKFVVCLSLSVGSVEICKSSR